ncbi:MAG: glycosyltransferase family 4 protein [Actinobacteria bacterium]|nr:glycosyltransferase family 4 protein [Actinomycetota bacterium]
MRILQVPANAGYGGMPLHVLTLSKGLAARGHVVEILCMGDGPMVSAYERAGFKVTVVTHLSSKSRRDPLTLIRTIRFLRAAVARSAPEIIHTHGPRASFFMGLTLFGRRRIPLVASAHGSYSQFSFGHETEFGVLKSKARGLQYRWIDRLTGRLADLFIAVCEATRKDIVEGLGVPEAKVVVVHNGIEDHRADAATVKALRAGLGYESGNRLVVFVGRVAFHKGVGYLADAAESVLMKLPEARFLVVGEGPMEEALRQRAEKPPLIGRFTLMGMRTNALEIIAMADLLVLPSLSEGLPLSLLEAAMSGKAMVASNVGGVSEVVVEGETGLLVNPRDSDALATAISSLLNNDDERENMGAAARRLWEMQFTADGMTGKMEEEYFRLLAR